MAIFAGIPPAFQLRNRQMMTEEIRLQCYRDAVASTMPGGVNQGRDVIAVAKEAVDFVQGKNPLTRADEPSDMCGVNPNIVDRWISADRAARAAMPRPVAEYQDAPCPPGPMASSPRRVGDVEMQMVTQENLLNELGSTVSNLAERLAAAIRTPPASPKGPDAVRPAGTCPLSDAIAGNNARLNEMMGRLHQIWDAIDL